MARTAILALAGLMLAGSLAQPALAGPASGQNARDPNERVCEAQVVVGSRLAQKKVCATRAEWAAKRAAERQSVNDLQRLTGAVPCVREEIGGGHVVPC